MELKFNLRDRDPLEAEKLRVTFQRDFLVDLQSIMKEEKRRKTKLCAHSEDKR